MVNLEGLRCPLLGQPGQSPGRVQDQRRSVRAGFTDPGQLVSCGGNNTVSPARGIVRNVSGTAYRRCGEVAGLGAKAPEVKPLGQRPLSGLSVGFPPPRPATALRVFRPPTPRTASGRFGVSWSPSYWSAIHIQLQVARVVVTVAPSPRSAPAASQRKGRKPGISARRGACGAAGGDEAAGAGCAGTGPRSLATV